MHTVIALLFTAEILGLVSIVIAGLVGAPEPDVAMSLTQVWFYALPLFFESWLRPARQNTVALAAVVYMGQYLLTFAVLWGVGYATRRLRSKKAMAQKLDQGKGKAFEGAVAMYYSNKDYW